MIAHLRGIVTEKFGQSVIIDVGGVGYEVALAGMDFENAQLETEVKLYTYHHVREQSEELFGFSSLAGKKLFELLISVQGVGPKAGMAILSLGVVEEVRNAIANADDGYVAGASGVGKKTAERVIVDLRDKVGLPVYYGRKGVEASAPESDEALEALMALGYSLRDATVALEKVEGGLNVGERVRMALKG